MKESANQKEKNLKSTPHASEQKRDSKGRFMKKVTPQNEESRDANPAHVAVLVGVCKARKEHAQIKVLEERVKFLEGALEKKETIINDLDNKMHAVSSAADLVVETFESLINYTNKNIPFWKRRSFEKKFLPSICPKLDKALGYLMRSL